MFKAPFSFNGRIRRLEMWLSYLIYCFAITAAQWINEFVFNSDIVLILLIILIFWFVFAQQAKRCHDRGDSGWYQIIPFYGFVLLFADGEIGENDYGLSPKEKGNKKAEDLGDNF
jgi:uncharacterized membrane protein YhaH (DUF805 family)